ncbi:MAG: zf-HC2 domain-containing protein [Anaerolineales bacterium]|nr:zf-HC2 domain-containing protein [Anaerolineales bacterium]
MDKEQHCPDLLSELADFMDGTATIEVCAEIEKHMAECPDCRVMVDTLEKTIYLYRNREERFELPSGFRERLFTSLHLEDYLKD